MKVIKLDEYRDLIEIIESRLGEKFIISYLDEDELVHTYLSKGLTHMEEVYMGENIKEISFDRERE